MMGLRRERPRTNLHLLGCRRKRIIVTLSAYFDGSGKDDVNPIITVGGYFADTNLCKSIEKEWEEATGNRLFHFTDFGTQACKLGSNTWTGKEGRSFLKRLAAIVTRSGCGIISTSLEIAPFNQQLAQTVHPNEIGPAFSACAYTAIAMTEWEVTMDGRLREELRYVFEKGDRETEITQLFVDLDKNDSEWYGSRSHAFEPKKTTLLQPADFIAGVVQRCLLRAYEPLKCLDNGKAKTKLRNFEHHYDEVTHSLLDGHDDSCCVMNAKNFTHLDMISKTFLEVYPEQLPKRKKRYPYKPKIKK
jgi:hypothetical protein